MFYGSKDMFLHHLCPFWGANKKFNIFPYFMLKMQNSLFLPCKTSVGNNSDSIEDRAVKFAYSRGFFGNCGLNGVTAIFVT